MTGRVLALSSALLALAFGLGCSTTQQLETIAVSPATATVANAGDTAQFQATGTNVNGKKGTESMQNLTNQVTWTSSTPSVATINSSGLATAVAAGTTTITATGGNGGITGTATLTVTSSSSSGGAGTLTSIAVIPSSQTVNVQGETAQYIAIGTFTGTPPTQDLTDLVTWSSSDVRVATIDAAGLATGIGDCGPAQQTTITALSPPSFGVAVTATATFNIATCGTNNLPSLTLYDFGQGTGTVLSSPGGIDCGAGLPQAGCTGHFVLGAPVMLTATPTTGSIFGGFSANCAPVVPDPSSCPATSRESDVTSCTCSLTMTDNATVGAIFNLPQ